MSKRIRLSAGELELLDVLWKHEGLTIREVQQAIGRELGYSTIQTRLNRLVAKGHAHRTPQRPGRYTATLKRETVSVDDLDSLTDRVTSGNVVPLIAHLVRDRELSTEEIEEVRLLIDEAERRKGSK